VDCVPTPMGTQIATRWRPIRNPHLHRDERAQVRARKEGWVLDGERRPSRKRCRLVLSVVVDLHLAVKLLETPYESCGYTCTLLISPQPLKRQEKLTEGKQRSVSLETASLGSPRCPNLEEPQPVGPETGSAESLGGARWSFTSATFILGDRGQSSRRTTGKTWGGPEWRGGSSLVGEMTGLCCDGSGGTGCCCSWS
jgi:hypothetical protein